MPRVSELLEEEGVDSKKSQNYLSIVEVKICLITAGISFVSMHTNELWEGSCDFISSASSPREPMNMTKELTLSRSLNISMASLEGEMPYREKLASEKRMRNLKQKENF